ncbi:MAG: VCBS repeat-containing protein [Burkholderiaceae bacterium]|jgi:hypothetical protein|nr:VCBS repeat-containing protein [Burkholderiaceae bacterium]
MSMKFVATTAAAALLGALFLAGCHGNGALVEGAGTTPPAAGASQAAATQIKLDSPHVWGGEVRCPPGGGGCLLVAIEHERNAVALYKLQGRSARLLDRQGVAYHPDSAVWLSDDLLAAAVEESHSLDIFRVEGDKLRRTQQIRVGFAPRDVVLVRADEGDYTLLVTPYSGKNVAWVRWASAKPDLAQVQSQSWCEAPWHPTRIQYAPDAPAAGLTVACLKDRKVIATGMDSAAAIRDLAQFDAVARHARPSPSGKWLYVALETGGKNARIDMQSGAVQYLESNPRGNVAAAPLSDDLVIWGDDRRLGLQRFDAAGQVLETRWLKTSGFSTGLQLVDVDADGALDVVVLNSAGSAIDVIYGPLWEQATETLE